MTGAAIYEDNRIAAAKAERAARTLPTPRINTSNAQVLQTCLRCQCTLRTRIGLIGYLRKQCNRNPKTSNSAPSSAKPTSESQMVTPVTDSPTPTIVRTESQYSSPVTHNTTTTTATAATTTTRNGDSVITCPQCDCTLTSRTGLIGHFLYGTPTPWDPSQVWWYTQGRLRPRQPPAPSLISVLLGSVLIPGSGGGGGESAMAAAHGYNPLKLIHAQVTVPAPPGVEHTVDLVEIDG
ncbi:unnamed protein product [Schistocephalus solidus]|uniref:C2H2-type domain-containing protein n=1 Tax=Schistocephalus solidus TaxID=70667 RepID=A0A183TCU9_SCHSO|nr:unnamed protein product [Schistocephalus solidus]